MQELDYGKMGMRIRQLRKAKGWSQGGLAQKCGISMSFLGHIERGSRIMSMETFANICMALDAGADELLWGVCDKQTDKTEAEGGKNTDSYAMYVKIMKSVAEIMNEA